MPGPADLPDALTDRVAYLLQLAVARAQAMGEEALDDVGLSGREYGILAQLEHGAPSAQHHLGAALGLDRTTTMKVLAGLEARGLVRRERDAANRRAYRVILTDTGEDLRARAAEVLADCDDRFLAPLQTHERADLRTVLRRLL